jgi:predicted HTH transcriptional regulator
MKTKIFISGVQKELRAERRAVKDFILGNTLFRDYFEVFLFEDVPAKSHASQDLYLRETKNSNIYLGIWGNQYGGDGKGKVSPTEAEFRESRKAKKQVLVFLKGSDDKVRDEGIRKLVSEIKDQVRGVIYKRFNDVQELTDLVFDSLLEILKEQGIVGRGDFDERLCQRASLGDIDEDKIRWFLKIARATRKYPLKLDTSINDVLIHLDLMQDGKLTNAAVLLFGKNPYKFFKQGEVKCLQFSGTVVKKPFLSYQPYHANLFEQVDKAAAFVLDAIKFPVIQKAGTSQFSRPFEIPEFTIREAIVNAIAHRNYNDTSGVQVMVFADRVEIWNSGTMPSDLSVADLRKPHTSFPANPLIANAFYLADYAQRAGSGTLEMIEQCRVQGAPEPEFVMFRNDKEFRSILPRDVLTENILTKMGLSERQMAAVRVVKEKGKISNQDYVAISGLNSRTALRDLNDLCDKGILQKIGKTGRNTQYILTRHKPDKPDMKRT